MGKGSQGRGWISKAVEWQEREGKDTEALVRQCRFGLGKARQGRGMQGKAAEWRARHCKDGKRRQSK